MEKETNARETGLAESTAAASINDINGPDVIIEQSAVEGLDGAIKIFLRTRKIPLSYDSAVRFAQLITAEFSPNEEERKLYPLSKSIKANVEEALRQSSETILALHKAHEIELARKMVRVIVSGEVILVIESEMANVMKICNELLESQK